MRRKTKVKICLCLVIFIYLCVTVYCLYAMLKRDKVPQEGWDSIENKFGPIQTQPSVKKHDIISRGARNGKQVHIVEVWGKAAIGLYFWEHIMNAELESKMGGVWSYGQKMVKNIQFRFRTGPGVLPNKVPRDTNNLILVINGREPSKVKAAKIWLNELQTFPLLKNVAVILLGNEQCNNDWINEYMIINGGLVKMVFLVYDSPQVDNDAFYQWPLGVATYRDFPKIPPDSVDVTKEREYTCNFLGTVYPDSSRTTLMEIIDQYQLRKICKVVPRYEWVPNETAESLDNYIESLETSDLTLNPVDDGIMVGMSSSGSPFVEGRGAAGFLLLDQYSD
ncbi:unnamed protein product [Owenia fusiformis]|uniref:Uncharacterized protein n=1 Tax=Owenia fusiformis TaxID=6347 RepID=A0A8J1T751_OWEFU|nr:unnamed protein product [Owenia fusiformis]